MMPSDKYLSFKEAIQLAHEAGGKRHILLGNGFSIGAHEKFRYGTLYEQAKKIGLPKHVESLFERYGTTNFEEVLKQLSEGRWLASHYKLAKTDPNLDMGTDYEKVKDAFVGAVTASHPANRNEIADQKLEACNAFLTQFNNVFTTNYDLLLYWASLATSPFPFKDGFWGTENPQYLTFVSLPESANTEDGYIYFLHGTLHLYAQCGEVIKMCRGGGNPQLLIQVEEALAEDRFPLVVSEGDPGQKKVRIRENFYLRACRRNFQQIEGSLFVFGSSLGTGDAHIREWIVQNQKLERLFVGVHGDPEKERNQDLMLRIRHGVESHHHSGEQTLRVDFYDSSTANVWTSMGHDDKTSDQL